MAKNANTPPKKKRPPNGPKNKSPNIIEYRFGADFLQGAGPVILASWWLPEALRKQLDAGLLGRDVLRNTKFNYDGVNGKLRMVFCD